MAKDNKYLNQSQDYELKNRLEVNGLRGTKGNISILKDIADPYSTHKEADKAIDKDQNKFEKKK